MGNKKQQKFDAQGESSDSSVDDAVQHALIIGDYKGAVSLCINANRMADALVIAHVGGASLWESTRDQYFKMSHSSYLKVVSAMVKNDLTSLVNSRPLHSWKETLALLCTFAEREDWTGLCDSLALRLRTSGNTLAATLCYTCAGNIDKTVEIWSQNLRPDNEGKTYIDFLQDLMEKTMVLALATGQKRLSASLSKLVEKYVELLASQGLLETAMEYLKLLGSEESFHELSILRDRIGLAAEESDAPKTSHLDNNQLQPESTYGVEQLAYNAVDGSHNYYQAQPHQSISSSPYGESFQQPFGASYGGGYVSPAPYQAASQPQIFLPSQAPPVSQGNFPPPVTAQPSVRPFVPATPPVLRNVEQYQQPTLGSQLYPGVANPMYHSQPSGYDSFGTVPSQVGQAPGHRLPQVVAPVPAPAPTSFMPVSNSGYAQGPGIGMVQPSPAQPAQVGAAATPAVPPPTMQTVDTSKVPAQQRPVITTLTRLFNETSEALGGSRANPAKKREIEDNSRKIGALFAKLNSGDISKNAADKLVQLCQALDNGDFSTALQIQVLLTTSEWDECNFWLATLKRMIKTRQNMRLN